MDYLAEVQRAVEATHGCTAKHVETVPIKEVFKGNTVWEGEVEVFEITGHQKAKRAYGWGYPREDQGGKFEFVAVLELPPVTSPQTAVRAAIVAQSKGGSNQQR
jgi:hypothetical protein